MKYNFFKSQFLIRFDDIHECMNWDIWDQIEEVLDIYKIKPLVAVIPKNKDSSLGVWPKNAHYKDRYISMSNKGYEMCQHGYDHVYISSDQGLFGLSPRSEFAGVDLILQEQKISKGKAILQDLGINPRCWIGPNHSFDSDTITILKDHGFSVISDSLHRLPYMYDEELIIVPCQKWAMNHFIPGLYTVCYHHNNWDSKMLSQFKRDVAVHMDKIVCLDDVLEQYMGRRKTWSDSLLASASKFLTHYVKTELRSLGR